VAWRVRRRPRLARSSRVFSVLTPLPTLVQQLNEFQPAILDGYASVMEVLAYEQQAGRLRIRPVLITPAGETFGAELRASLKSAFGSLVRESYGASEALMISYECRQGGQHVNADWYLLEPVDEAHRPVPPGVLSQRVLVTNLANRVQPFIRYELSDRVMVHPEPCACGSLFPTIKVEGRTDETLSFLTPDGAKVHILPMSLASAISRTPGLQSYQMIHTAPDVLSVRIATHESTAIEEVWTLVEQSLRAYLAAQGIDQVEIKRAAEPPTPNPLSGKLRRVWVDFSAPTEVGRAG
jgi:phenylacetate-coenzyme A ligase PaaK-like adenylate-forming protein